MLSNSERKEREMASMQNLMQKKNFNIRKNLNRLICVKIFVYHLKYKFLSF